jgi:glycosyltransferase involved in cell wall biosynthesis
MSVINGLITKQMSIEPIEFFPGVDAGKEIFSILIPTWNNLEYLKLCVASIRKNSRLSHQIIIHINEGGDGTCEWVKEQGFDHTHSPTNAGVCYAFNAAATLARSEYLLLIDDDNYLLPDWDYYLWEEVEKIGHPYFAVSGTKIEPYLTLNKCVIAPRNYGISPGNFREDEILRDYLKIPHADWNGSNWYPLCIHKNLWNLVGGLSVEFTPGMYSDPDFMMKLWHAGVRYFKGVNNSRSYHFISSSVKRVKKNNGRKQFLQKWGISNSTFRIYYLHLGEPFLGYLSEPEMNLELKLRLFRDRMKHIFSV